MHIASNKIINRFEAHTKPLTSVSLSSDLSHVLTSSQDGLAIVYDTLNTNIIYTIQHDEGSAINHAIFSPDNSMVLTASNDNKV